MQYEFRGKSLEQALQRSLRGDGRSSMRPRVDGTKTASCRQVARWIAELERDAGDIANELRDVERELRRLEQSRRDNLSDAAIGAATAAAGALGSAVRSANTARRLLRGGGARLDDVLAAVPYIGGAIITARSALAAARDTREIRNASDELSRLARVSAAIEGTARELREQWRENRCDING